MHDRFLKLLNQYIQFGEKEVRLLFDRIVFKNYNKNEMIFREGNISKTIYLVIEGCVRLFYLHEGKDRTAHFYTEGKFICAGESYNFGVPAKENYQAVEETILVHFPKHAVDELLQLSQNFEILARIATEDELITCQKMIASFVTLSPEERYEELLKTNANLFQRVPQQYIASFLGVSAETLSRIKKRAFNKPFQWFILRAPIDQRTTII